MCIIIAKPSSAKHPTDEIIEECWDSNPHGAGIAYANAEGGVTIQKGFMTLKDLKDALAPLRETDGAWYLVHFRIATHGTKGPENTHPFWSTKDTVAVAHNGVLPMSSLVNEEDGRSDTSTFADEVLAHMPKDWHKNKYLVHLVEEYMGRANKLAIIDSENVTLLNASAWNKDEATGLYFSNYSWRPSSYHSNTGYYGGATASQNFRTPTATQSHSSPISQSAKTRTGSTTGAGAANSRTRKRAIAELGRRCAVLVNSKILQIGEASQLKALATSEEYLPEEVEEVLDFFMEMREAMPNLDLDGLMLSAQARDLYELADMVIEMTGGGSKDETTKIPAIPLTTDLSDLDIPPEQDVYNEENTQCFVGQVVRISTQYGTGQTYKRVVKVTRVADKGFSGNHNWGLDYAVFGKDTHDGWSSFSTIVKIEGLMVLNQPTAATLKDFKGYTMQCLLANGASMELIIGDIEESGSIPRVHIRSATTASAWYEPITNIVSAAILEVPERKKETALTAST